MHMASIGQSHRARANQKQHDGDRSSAAQLRLSPGPTQPTAPPSPRPECAKTCCAPGVTADVGTSPLSLPSPSWWPRLKRGLSNRSSPVPLRTPTTTHPCWTVLTASEPHTDPLRTPSWPWPRNAHRPPTGPTSDLRPPTADLPRCAFRPTGQTLRPRLPRANPGRRCHPSNSRPGGRTRCLHIPYGFARLAGFARFARLAGRRRQAIRQCALRPTGHALDLAALGFFNSPQGGVAPPVRQSAEGDPVAVGGGCRAGRAGEPLAVPWLPRPPAVQARCRAFWDCPGGGGPRAAVRGPDGYGRTPRGCARDARLAVAPRRPDGSDAARDLCGV